MPAVQKLPSFTEKSQRSKHWSLNFRRLLNFVCYKNIVLKKYVFLKYYLLSSSSSVCHPKPQLSLSFNSPVKQWSWWVISFFFAPCYIICWNNGSHLKLIVISAFFQNNICISYCWSTALSNTFPFFFLNISNEFENTPCSVLLLNYSVSFPTHEFLSISLVTPQMHLLVY